MATHHLNVLADSKNALSYVEGGKLHLIDKGHSPQVDATVLNTATGLISMPVETPQGIIVTALINPKFSVNGRLKINNADINPADPVMVKGGIVDPKQQEYLKMLDVDDGTYRILAIDWTGDTRGQPWYATMVTIGEKGDESYIIKSTDIKDPKGSEGPADATPNVPPGVPPSPIGGRSPGPV
jgi:hypothetical protein